MGNVPADWAMRASYEAESGIPYDEANALCEAWTRMWRESWRSAVDSAPEEAEALAEAVEAKYASHKLT